VLTTVAIEGQQHGSGVGHDSDPHRHLALLLARSNSSSMDTFLILTPGMLPGVVRRIERGGMAVTWMN
jgi:hypothetical protein